MAATFRVSAQIVLRAWLILVICSAAVIAQEPAGAPQTQNWVTDQTGVLSSSTKQMLARNARSFEKETTHQVVVVSVKSLAGWTIERYGRWLGNTWGIGQADKDNGVLLLVAPNDRKVRIEVGRGLEDVITNAIAQQIIDDEILPKFRNDDLEAGIVAGHTAILQALGGEYRAKTNWEELIHFILVPFLLIGRLFGFGGRGSGGFSGGGGSFGGGGASGSW